MNTYHYLPSDNAVTENHGLHFQHLLADGTHDLAFTIVDHDQRTATTRIGNPICGTPSTDNIFKVLIKALQQDPNQRWTKPYPEKRTLPEMDKRFISSSLAVPGEEPYLWLAVEGASFRIGVCYPQELARHDFSLVFTPRSRRLRNFFTDLALGFETAHNQRGHRYALSS